MKWEDNTEMELREVDHVQRRAVLVVFEFSSSPTIVLHDVSLNVQQCHCRLLLNTLTIPINMGNLTEFIMQLSVNVIHVRLLRLGHGKQIMLTLINFTYNYS
jgi:hypothetical protein